METSENKEIIYYTDANHQLYTMDTYKKLDKLGRGSYGRVYLVKNSSNKALYAMKKFKLVDGIHPTTLRELSLLKILQHPNIVSFHQVIMKDKYCFMIMEYLPKNLSDYITNKKLTPELIFSFKFQLLQAVLFCHNRRIIHRDIKPMNILIHDNGKVLKLCDFGLARQLPVHVEKLTPQMVTLMYRAPEILLGDRHYFSPIDIWSLGCVFVEMWIGHSPFRGYVDLDIWFEMFIELGVPKNEDCFGAAERFASWNFNWDDDVGELSMEKLKGLVSAEGYDLIMKMLTYNQFKRITAYEALKHPYFNDLDKSTVPAYGEEDVGFFKFRTFDEEPKFHLTVDEIRKLKKKVK